MSEQPTPYQVLDELFLALGQSAHHFTSSETVACGEVLVDGRVFIVTVLPADKAILEDGEFRPLRETKRWPR